MKTSYSFVVLRYVHDIVTGEFINVGVAVYAPGARYIGALCTTRYRRLSDMFLKVDGEYFRGLMRYIQNRFEEEGARLRNELPLFGTPADIMEIAKKILPPDDSSLQWSEPGGGQTADPAATLEELYARLVDRYEQKLEALGRQDSDVWKVYKKELETKHVLAHLAPKRIVARDYEYEFDHARKNEQWHVYEPVSLDLQEADSIRDKANRWLGRITTLRDSSDDFKVYFLLGEPSLEKHRSVYTQAENILNKTPGDKELIREREAEGFSKALADDISKHGGEE